MRIASTVDARLELMATWKALWPLRSCVGTALVFAALSCGSIPIQAQPETQPPLPFKHEPAPQIDPAARALFDAVLARYAALRSYSDTVQLLPDGAKDPLLDAKVAFERPGRFRFEGQYAGKTFLALGTGTTEFALDPEHPEYYVSRPQSEQDRIHEPMFNVQAGAPGFGDLFGDTTFDRLTHDGLRVLALDPDADVDGVSCRVLRMGMEFDDGGAATIRTFVGKSDGVMHRVIESFAGKTPVVAIVENHTDIKLDEALPADLWKITPPAGLQRVAYFSELDKNERAPTLQVGSSLPPFDAADVKGQNLHLGPDDKKPLVLVFTTLGMTPATLAQRQWKEFTNRYAAHGVRLVVVYMDARVDRVQQLVADGHIDIPVYADANGWHNALATRIGIKSTPTALYFDASGTLHGIYRDAADMELEAQLDKLPLAP